MNRRHRHISGLLALALTLGAVGALQLLPSGQQAQAAAEGQGTGQDKRTLAEQLVHDLREGSLAIEGDHAAVSELILKRNIPIPSKYIESLMWAPNAFGAGPACVICHSSNDPARSYRGLDLSTCEGILQGLGGRAQAQALHPGQGPQAGRPGPPPAQ